MGYTHYYYQKPRLNQTQFFKVARDFKKMVPVMQHLGVKLGDYHGENTPIIRPDEIAFNGFSKCGHTQKDLGIAWPAPDAKGILKDGVRTILSDITKSNWSWGAELQARTCGGDCAHETFSLMQESDQTPDQKTGYVFECTKTAYKPYDLAVNVALIIAKEYLKDDIVILSDGTDSNWVEGKQLCQHFLGYGENFKLDTGDILEQAQKETTEKTKKAYDEASKNIDMSSVKVGDIFERSWGYDQTNVNFVKVVEVSKTGKSAKVIPIGSKHVESLSSMSGKVVADPDNEFPNKYDDKKPSLYRIKKGSSSVYLGPYWKWDGKPCYTSSYA